MKNRFAVVVPTITPRLVNDMLASLAENTLLPTNAVVIDNSDREHPIIGPNGFATFVIRPQPGRGAPFAQYDSSEEEITGVIYRPDREKIGVNQSWMEGISHSLDSDFVSILNDDILVRPEFFQRLAEAFDRNPEACCICPNTFSDKKMITVKWKINGAVLEMHRREGWAMTWRKEVLESLPPIPPQLKTFCGDDWWFHHSRKAGWKWFKDTGNVIWHAVGASMAESGHRPDMKHEKRLFRELIRN